MITRRERRPITKRAVDAMQPGDVLWDTVLGFHARCQVGARVYAVKARIAGRQRLLTIGKHGSPWTVETARDEAKRLLGLIAAGKDPASAREKAKAVLTVAEVAKQFLAQHCGVDRLEGKFEPRPGASVKPTTARGYRDTLRDDILPRIGKFRCDAVTAADLAKIHHDMQATPRAANYVLSVMSKMSNWAANRHLWPNPNPAIGIERYPENRRTKALTQDETDRLVCAIAVAEAEKRISPYSAAAIRFLLLCGLRPKEALHIRWKDIDFSTGRVHLPATKTGPRTATLSTHALEHLKVIPRIRNNPYVFCGHKTGRPLSSLQHAFETIWADAKLPEEVVLYSLRHNFGTTLADNRVEAYELMKMMGHKNLSTSLIYIHLRDEGIQATSTKATAGLAAALAKAGKSNSSDVPA